MGDAGAIGSIIEDIIYVVKCMNDKGELSNDKLKCILLILSNINNTAMEQNIDLYIDEEYINYMEEYLKI